MDLVLFCVKSYHTAGAAHLLPPLVGPETAILSVQNGVDNERQIAAVVGPGPVLGAIAGMSAYVEAPAVIAERGGAAFIRFGELAGGVSPRTERLQRGLQGAGFAAAQVPDITRHLWEKFFATCGLAGVTALTRLPLGPLLADPATRRLLLGVMEEAATVGRAAGAALPGDAVERWRRVAVGFPPGIYGSMYHDLTAGRRLELEGLNGTVVRLRGQRRADAAQLRRLRRAAAVCRRRGGGVMDGRHDHGTGAAG